MSTKMGMINKIPVTLFKKIRSTGLKAIVLKPGDELLGAHYTSPKQQLMLIADNGKAIRFSEQDILVGAPSSQWWVDLSSTIAGGLTFATFLTLIATPALLVIGRTSVFSIKNKLVTLLKTKLSTKTVST